MSHKRDLVGNVVKDMDAESRIKEDFRAFLWLTWRHLGLPEPTETQYDIARFMQHGPKQKMIMAFRGVGKSWIYGAFVCWRLYCDPQWKIMVVSASKVLADDFSKFVKRLIHEMPILAHLKPRAGQRDSNVSFDVGPASASKDPSVKSVGITGQITGSRADEILADDIESLNNSATEGARQVLSEAIKEFRFVVKPESGYITYLGTPQTAMSIYNKLPERGYTIRVWTARIPKDPEVYHGRLAPFITRMILKGLPAGTPVDSRFPDSILIGIEAEAGRAGWQLQYMLNTADADADRYPLKLSNLITMSLDHRLGPSELAWGKGEALEGLHTSGLPGDAFYGPVFDPPGRLPFERTVMSIDPSGRGKDETTFVVLKILHGMLFLMDAGGFTDGFGDETLKGLASKAAHWGVNRLVIERNMGDGMFTALLNPHLIKAGAACEIEEVWASTQKEARIIDTLEPLIAQHRLVVDRDLVNKDYESTPGDNPAYSLFFQMTRITRDKGSLAHDDRLDALAWAVAEFTEDLDLDHNAAAKEAEDAAWEAAIEEWLDEAQTIDDRSYSMGRFGSNMIHDKGSPKRFH